MRDIYLNDELIAALCEGALPEEMRCRVLQAMDEDPFLHEVYVTTTELIDKPDENVVDLPVRSLEKAIALFPLPVKIYDAVLELFCSGIRSLSSAAEIMASFPVPFAVPLRGNSIAQSNLVVLKKSFPEFEMELDIEKTAEDRCAIRVALSHPDGSEPPAALRAELIADGRELYSCLLKEFQTRFEGLVSGVYDIRIQKNGRIYGDMNVKIL